MAAVVRAAGRLAIEYRAVGSGTETPWYFVADVKTCGDMKDALRSWVGPERLSGDLVRVTGKRIRERLFVFGDAGRGPAFVEACGNAMAPWERCLNNFYDVIWWLPEAALHRLRKRYARAALALARTVVESVPTRSDLPLQTIEAGEACLRGEVAPREAMALTWQLQEAGLSFPQGAGQYFMWRAALLAAKGAAFTCMDEPGAYAIRESINDAFMVDRSAYAKFEAILRRHIPLSSVAAACARIPDPIAIEPM